MTDVTFSTQTRRKFHYLTHWAKLILAKYLSSLVRMHIPVPSLCQCMKNTCCFIGMKLRLGKTRVIWWIWQTRLVSQFYFTCYCYTRITKYALVYSSLLWLSNSDFAKIYRNYGMNWLKVKGERRDVLNPDKWKWWRLCLLATDKGYDGICVWQFFISNLLPWIFTK